MAKAQGVGYNPRPDLPDPFAVTAAKGLIANPGSPILHFNNPPTRPEGLGDTFIPGDPEVHAAWMARYNMLPHTIGPKGAEKVMTVWPRVLRILWQHQRPGFGNLNDFDGNVAEREAQDAAFFGNKSMICEAYKLDNSQGYSAENPIPFISESLSPGLHTVVGRAKEGEPQFYKDNRDRDNGCTLYYFNRYQPGTSVPSPTPSPQPSPTPSPSPSPAPFPLPDLSTMEPWRVVYELAEEIKSPRLAPLKRFIFENNEQAIRQLVRQWQRTQRQR